MATYYIYSGAAGGGTGADWANAFTTMATAINGKAAGDVFYVAHDHSETTAAAVTITSPGTEANPCKIYCVDRAGSVPPVSADLRTTAQVACTGNNNMSLAGSASCYGIIFAPGTSTNNASVTVSSTTGRTWRLVNCALRLGGNASTPRIHLGAAGGNTQVVLENTTLQFAHINQQVNCNARIIWRNTPSVITGATIPTVLLNMANGGNLFAEGVDFSAVTTGKSMFTSAATSNSNAVLKDCKLGAGNLLDGTPSAFGGIDLAVFRSDASSANYKFERHNAAGSQTVETTIVRTDGATDGTTPVAVKIVTTANSRWEFPFECLPISIWNDTTGAAITVTLQGIWGGGAVPLNDDIWMDVEYLGTSGFPLAVKATCSKADGLTTGSNLPAGSGTWGGSTTKFALAATFTPQIKGPLTIYVNAAKASSTFYIDPKPVIT